jgi:hypothetical protein
VWVWYASVHVGVRADPCMWQGRGCNVASGKVAESRIRCGGRCAASAISIMTEGFSRHTAAIPYGRYVCTHRQTRDVTVGMAGVSFTGCYVSRWYLSTLEVIGQDHLSGRSRLINVAGMSFDPATLIKQDKSGAGFVVSRFS